MKRLALLAFVWGWSFLFIKVAVQGMTPPTVAAGRVGLGAVVLVAALRLRRVALPRDRRLWRHATVAAVFGNALPFTLLAWGEERITSALTAVANATTPLFTALVASVLLRDRLRPVQLAGLLGGVAGVAVAAGLAGSDVSGSSVSGALASVGAAACYGVAFTYMRKHLIGVDPIVASATQLCAAAAMLAPFAVATSVADGLSLTPTRVASILLLGLVGTGLAYVLNYRIIGEVGATKASLVTYLIPVVAVAVGVVVLDEAFSWRLVAGGLLIVAGIAAVNERRIFGPGRRLLGVGSAAGVVVVGVMLAAALALPACGDDGDGGGGGGGACGPVVTEKADPASIVHILPGADEPDYRTDPPTSGPHQPGRRLQGVVTEPLSRPVQVGALESGQVLVQHGDLAAGDVAALGELAGDDVVVAPNPGLPAPIVATAWLHKLSCERADVGALRRFVEAHAGRGPGTD